MKKLFRQLRYKSLCRFSIAMGAATLLLPAIGCANGDSFMSAKAADRDTNTMLAESHAVQTDAAKAIHTTLVSAKMPSTPVRQPIITLPPNADLQQQLTIAPGPVLLDFYADWCGPCQKQSKILHEVEDTAAQTQTTIIKINIDNHRELARQFNVSSLPTLMLIDQGQMTQRHSGIVTQQQLAGWIQ